MRKQLRIFLAGVMIVAPFVVTVYVIWWAGTALDGLARSAVTAIFMDAKLFPGLGAILVVVGIYLIGLLTHWWVFRWILGLLEGLVSRLPVVKTIYESVRDILGLFGGDANRMGQVVRYRVPGTEMELLGIRTSSSPRGASGSNKVAVYLPMSYMVGGPTVYVDAESVEPVDMSVEEALKIAATAEATGTSPSEQPQGNTPAPER